MKLNEIKLHVAQRNSEIDLIELNAQTPNGLTTAKQKLDPSSHDRPLQWKVDAEEFQKIIEGVAKSLSMKPSTLNRITAEFFESINLNGKVALLRRNDLPCDTLQVQREVGRGAFGTVYYVLKCTGSTNGKSHHALKVAKTSRHSIAWEAFIFHLVGINYATSNESALFYPYFVLSHSQINLRADREEQITTFLLSPSHLYIFKNSSALLLPYGELGTLIDAIAVLNKEFNAVEHENIVANIASQVSLLQ